MTTIYVIHFEHKKIFLLLTEQVVIVLKFIKFKFKVHTVHRTCDAFSKKVV